MGQSAVSAVERPAASQRMSIWNLYSGMFFILCRTGEGEGVGEGMGRGGNVLMEIPSAHRKEWRRPMAVVVEQSPSPRWSSAGVWCYWWWCIFEGTFGWGPRGLPPVAEVIDLGGGPLPLLRGRGAPPGLPPPLHRYLLIRGCNIQPPPPHPSTQSYRGPSSAYINTYLLRTKIYNLP